MNLSFSSKWLRQALESKELSLEIKLSECSESVEILTLSSVGQSIIDFKVELIIGSIKSKGYWLYFKISMASIIPLWKWFHDELAL